MARPAHSQPFRPIQDPSGRERQRRDAANRHWARDPARLMPGERPETACLDEAVHWVELYRELREFNLELISAINKHLSRNGHHPGEAEGPDLELIQAHLERIDSRLQYWETTLAGLSSESRRLSLQAARGGRTRPSR